ncbi:hypothetical protein H4R19_006240, partial [Coemansia spiralis]
AKKNFISYLSPLTRILFAIATHVDGDAHGARSAASADDPSGAKMDVDGADPTDGLPDAASDGGHGDDGDDDDGFDWPWLDQRLAMYVNASSRHSDVLADTLDALIDVYTHSSVRGLRRSIENAIAACCLHDSAVIQPVVTRLFGQRPLDVFTLHSLRPNGLSSLSPLPSPSGDADSQFRPAAEVYPLALRVVLLGLGDSGAAAATDAVANAIVDCMWAISEEPDVRRHLIALKPRLIPKEQRPSAGETSVSEDTVLQTTSASLHIGAEAAASAAAYALERSVGLLGLLAARADSDPRIQRLAVALAHSRALLAVLMIAVGDSMRQFGTLAPTRELLNTLCAVAEADGAATSQLWMGVNFYTLAQRLNSQLPEEYTTWAEIQAIPAK